MQQKPILTESIVAAAAIVAQRFVGFDDLQASVAGQAVLGVSDYEASAAGKAIAVTVLGTTKVEAGAAVARGDLVKSDANARAIPQGGAGKVVARALTGTNVVGALIEVLLIPAAT